MTVFRTLKKGALRSLSNFSVSSCPRIAPSTSGCNSCLHGRPSSGYPFTPASVFKPPSIKEQGLISVGRRLLHGCGGPSASVLYNSRLSSVSASVIRASVCRTCRTRAFSSTASSSSLPPGVAKVIGNVILIIGCGVATYYCFPHPQRNRNAQSPEEEHVVTNWSGTHEVKTKVYVQPETLEELETAVKHANDKNQKIRPVGSGLSPNGIGLCKEGMVNLALMDKILKIDKETNRVTVQAGARVEQVVEALRPHGLTLQNFASIKEQQIGGFIQVGAHGTGALLPPVDEQVVSLKLVTPGKGMLELSPQNDPDLFYLARCSLGTLGVVAEVTLQCVPIQRLLEHTFISNKKEVWKKHKKWLQENKHLRYMWIPYTDAVVVVQCNPLAEGKEPPKFKSMYSEQERLKHVFSFYKETALKYRTAEQDAVGNHDDDTTPNAGGIESDIGNIGSVTLLSDAELSELSFTELRDKLLAMDPLNREHVIRVNKVEADYWKRCEGYRLGWSDEILGFDCGGQQWVSEVCFPAGSLKKPDFKDLSFMERVLDLIKIEGIPAPAPIEQRWTSGSRSPLSLASSNSEDSLFSWVGIIMYLPNEDEAQKAAITKRFVAYRQATQRQLWDAYTAFEHWAKIEVPEDEESTEWIQDRLKKRFPVDSLNAARRELDPNGILSNEVIDKLFPL